MAALAKHDEDRELDRAGRAKVAQERTCALSREQRDPADLIRFVEGPDGQIVPDLKRKLPGRGVWITANAIAVAEAVRRNVFARSLKRPVMSHPGLAGMVDELMVHELLQSLAMAKKAGLAANGAFQVEKLISHGIIAALVQASDGSADGARKIEQALYRHLPELAAKLPRIEIFDSTQLGLALGHTNVIHAALKQGAATDAFLARYRRLAAYRAKQPYAKAGLAGHATDNSGSEVEDK